MPQSRMRLWRNAGIGVGALVALGFGSFASGATAAVSVERAATETATTEDEDIPPYYRRVPDIAAPTDEGPSATDTTLPEPANRATRKILDLKDSIYGSLTDTQYQHRTVIRRDEGIYRWDCSGMVAWFLRKTAPKARKALDKKRPVARDFYRAIAKAPTNRARNGWRRLPHIEDVRPGDMFAWKRPPGFPSRNTGHTGFALEPARKVPGLPGAYTLRILDATSLPHQDDTRTRADGGGIGEGTIMFMVDEHGRGTAYGWHGRRSRWVIVTDIVFGRVSR
ncbi:MAG: hypothetical protein AAF799_26265 [Myxococcota bacterium]